MSAEDKTINPGVEYRKGFTQERQICVNVSTSSAANDELKIQPMT